MVMEGKSLRKGMFYGAVVAVNKLVACSQEQANMSGKTAIVENRYWSIKICTTRTHKNLSSCATEKLVLGSPGTV